MILKLFAILFIFPQICNTENSCNGYCREKEDCTESEYGEGESECNDNLVCCKIGNFKSPEKCKEYGQYVYNEDFAPALMSRSLKQNVSECAIEAVPLIIGGTKAKEKEFPHMVAIGFGESMATAKWMCGGSLISDKFVLTAAHCATSRDRPPPQTKGLSGPAKFVRAGTLSLIDPVEPQAQDFTIVEIINHPKYKPPARYYDISLFKLSAPVEFNGFVRPACIGTSADEAAKFKKAYATGWGKLDYQDDSGSTHLMKVAISLFDYLTCQSYIITRQGSISLPRGLIPSQICAGELKGGKDTCQGDSGGPLQIVLNDPYCMYSIIGITSFGKFCGFRNSPAVYTRVSYFVPWIESIVWN